MFSLKVQINNDKDFDLMLWIIYEHNLKKFSLIENSGQPLFFSQHRWLTDPVTTSFVTNYETYSTS